jgi:SRSO17 transposase
VTPDEIARVRPLLLSFAERMLADALPRKDQRAKGESYLRGLLTDGQRKSMQPMAERLGVDHQGLQQFVTSSTWDHETVRANVARWGVEAIGPDAYVVDDTGFPKDGKASPLVARMYSGTLGKTANCQIGVSVQLVTDAASLAANWRLYCPTSWDDTALDDPETAEQVRTRRARSGVPDEVRHREKWRLALDMLDQMNNDWGLPKRAISADAGYGDVTGFRLGLEERGYSYVVAVKETTSAYAIGVAPALVASTGRGRPPKPRYREDPSNLRDLALAAGREAFVEVTWRHGTRKTPHNPTAAMTSTFLAIKARPANREIPRDPHDGTLPGRWLLVEWPDDKDEPTDYWLSNMDDATPLADLVRLAKIRWRIEHDYRELKTGLGLDHFEGRSFTGWHRHVTLTVLAQAFCTLLRLDPKAPAPA